LAGARAERGGNASLEQALPPGVTAGLRYPEFQLKMMGI
jgi:hypothetical protein